MGFLDKIQKKVKGKKKAALKEQPNLHRDWALSLVLLFALIFGAAIFAAYMFVDVENIELVDGEVDVGVSKDIIDQELLNETIEFYTEKEKRFTEFQTNFRGAPQI